ncbi:PREDICTED: protein kintoun [Charadrius vociferus]|uniref:protein kintoun n=1 Tax=Charadrius vociferus TaxID=50402 RepID=UPI0005214F2B|nr:PREDICTED: protein kintoun [Charadrius vociferus]
MAESGLSARDPGPFFDDVKQKPAPVTRGHQDQGSRPQSAQIRCRTDGDPQRQLLCFTDTCPPRWCGRERGSGAGGQRGHRGVDGSRPPFQCRQDEASLTLLLHVPAIQPQSLSGTVGVNHYSLRFSSDTGTYALFLQFPPANRLASPESSISVSAHNAAVGLAKAPGCTGPWEKFCFGLDASTLQPQEAVHSEHDGKEETLSSSGGDLAEKTSGDYPQTKAETNCTAADTAEGECVTETNKTSTSFATAETIGKVGCSSHHCLQYEPSDTTSAIPGESRRKEPDLESAVTVGETAVVAASEKQGGLLLEGQAEEEGGEAAAPAGSAPGNQCSWDSRPASPVLQEVNSQDGSVQIVRDHVTRCPVAFQNSLLYELD